MPYKVVSASNKDAWVEIKGKARSPAEKKVSFRPLWNHSETIRWISDWFQTPLKPGFRPLWNQHWTPRDGLGEAVYRKTSCRDRFEAISSRRMIQNESYGRFGAFFLKKGKF